MDLLIATSNPGKREEIRELLGSLPVRLLTLKDVGLDHMDVAEDATTVEGNARLKAAAYVEASRLLTLADDTGLFVEALGGAPGVYPARYGGPGLTMADRRRKLLGELAGVPDERRGARFECVMVLGNPATGETQEVRGICEGRIAQAEMNGETGFGYDPVFIPNGYDQSFAQLPAEVKNRISHRGHAASQMLPILQKIVES
jgi:XTP/dITP diphosphohydrolase